MPELPQAIEKMLAQRRVERVTVNLAREPLPAGPDGAGRRGAVVTVG